MAMTISNSSTTSTRSAILGGVPNVPPPASGGLITEDGNNLITEDGNNLVQESVASFPYADFGGGEGDQKSTGVTGTDPFDLRWIGSSVFSAGGDGTENLVGDIYTPSLPLRGDANTKEQGIENLGTFAGDFDVSIECDWTGLSIPIVNDQYAQAYLSAMSGSTRYTIVAGYFASNDVGVGSGAAYDFQHNDGGAATPQFGNGNNGATAGQDVFRLIRRGTDIYGYYNDIVFDFQCNQAGVIDISALIIQQGSSVAIPAVSADFTIYDPIVNGSPYRT